MDPATDELRQIGQVATLIGLSLRTIRYYEEVGLIAPQRTSGGFRLYSRREIERLELIMCMKPLEFTLVEMGDLLDARDKHSDPDPTVRSEAAGRLAMFTALAADRCARLREQLLAGEGLQAALVAELSTQRDE